MKNKLSIFLPMLVAGSIAAQGAKPAAKPPAKPAAPVAAPAKPAAPAAAVKAEATPAPAPAMASKTPMLTAIGWGGYNITIKDSAQSSGGVTFGGISGGADAYFNSLMSDGKLGVGIGAAFITYYTATTNSVAATNAGGFSFTTTTPAHRWNIIPIEAKARYKVWNDLTVGVMAGFALSNYTLLNAPTAPNFITVGILVGYDYALTDAIGLNAGVDVRYLISTDSAIVKGNLAFTPRLGVTYSF